MLSARGSARVSSAAQNGLLLLDCPHCGASNHEHASACYVCLAPISLQSTPPEAPESPRPDSQADDSVWRREVSDRLAAYRARRGDPEPTPRPSRRSSDAGQPTLPFGNPDGSPDRGHPVYRAALRTAGRPPITDPSTLSERVEIDAVDAGTSLPRSPDVLPGAPLIPVVQLSRRILAGAIDFAFLSAAAASFYGLFRLFGGELQTTRTDILYFSAALFLLYAQYVAIFTLFRSATPGMLLSGITPVSFDGELPTFAQLLARTFGYLLSGATAGLGFLWCLWDEDSLTWHDRISQTYLAPVSELFPAAESHSAGEIVDLSSPVTEAASPAPVLAAIQTPAPAAATTLAVTAAELSESNAPSPTLAPGHSAPKLEPSPESLPEPAFTSEAATSSAPPSDTESTLESWISLSTALQSKRQTEPEPALSPLVASALEQDAAVTDSDETDALDEDTAPLTRTASASAVPLPNPFRRAFPNAPEDAPAPPKLDPAADPAPASASPLRPARSPLSSFDPDDTNEILANYDDPFLDPDADLAPEDISSTTTSSSAPNGRTPKKSSPEDSTSDLYSPARPRRTPRP